MAKRGGSHEPLGLAGQQSEKAIPKAGLTDGILQIVFVAVFMIDEHNNCENKSAYVRAPLPPLGFPFSAAGTRPLAVPAPAATSQARSEPLPISPLKSEARIKSVWNPTPVRRASSGGVFASLAYSSPAGAHRRCLSAHHPRLMSPDLLFIRLCRSDMRDTSQINN